MSSFTDIAIFFKPEYKEVIEKFVVSPYSAKEDVKSLGGLPKLFIYSKNDKTVPFEHGQLIYNNAPEPKQFLEYKADHLEAISSEKDQVLKAIEKL